MEQGRDDLAVMTDADCFDPLDALTSPERTALRRACEPQCAEMLLLTEEEFEAVVHWARSMKTWNIFLDLLYRGHAHISEVKDHWPLITLTPQGSRLIRPHCGPG